MPLILIVSGPGVQSHQATVSKTVRLLAKKELIYKETNTLDACSYSIYLTEKGKKIATRSSLFSGRTFLGLRLSNCFTKYLNMKQTNNPDFS